MKKILMLFLVFGLVIGLAGVVIAADTLMITGKTTAEVE